MTSSTTVLPTDYFMSGQGLDPALRHGVLISATFHVSPDRGFTRLIKTNTLFRWAPRKPPSISIHDSIERVEALGQAICAHAIPNVAVGVDWDSSTGSWSNNTRQAVQMALLIGYTRRALQGDGCPVVHLTPAEVRGCFGLTATVPKAKVWEAFGLHVDIPKPFQHFFTNELDDHADSIVLAYLAAKADRQANRQLGEQDEKPIGSRTSGISRR